MEPAMRAAPAYRRLHKTGEFKVRNRALLSQIEDLYVVLFDEEADANPEIIEAALVVLVSYDVPNSALALEVESHGIPVRRVGDALSPRYIENAIRDGYMAGLSA
jgi:hypothetical protein